MSQPSPESPGYLHKRKTCFLSPGPAHTLLLLSFVTQTCLLDFLWFWTHFKFFLPKVIPGLLLLSLSWSSQVPAYLLGIFLVVAGKDIHFLPGRTHFSPLQWASWASIPPEAAVQKCPITVLLSVFFFPSELEIKVYCPSNLQSCFSMVVLLKVECVWITCRGWWKAGSESVGLVWAPRCSQVAQGLLVLGSYQE